MCATVYLLFARTLTFAMC